VSANAVLEHRSTPLGRRLERNRLRIALGVAAVEGVLVLAGAIRWWAVALVALVAVGVYWTVGREHRRPDVRTATWIAAVSQLTVVLVPVVATVAVALAVVLIVLLAGGALAVLQLDRR
jgi:drug/metabolite transporter (DMT)-like permease